jgi:glutathione synthase/RimK-type ligase-like ATP-grasp enzyme
LYEEDRPLLDALSRRGMKAGIAVWDDSSMDWGAFDVVLVRSPWDYPSRPEEFLAWYATVSAVTSVVNSYETVRGNQHKGYLRELWQRGAPTIPTAVIARPSAAASVAADYGWDEAVLKPAISMGGRGVHRLAEADLPALDAGSTGDWIVQPLLRRIEDEGEISLVYVDGQPTHAVRKWPAAGEIRIQESHGGSHGSYPLEPELLAVGDAVVDMAGVRGELVVRVDVIRDDEGHLLLGELELTSPRLFFGYCPSAVELLAEAVRTRLVLSGG